jgi:accessory colonization factor AcfC
MKMLKIAMDFTSLHLKTEFIRESQVIIVQIWKPKGISKTFEEELKKLANVLVDGYG